MKTKFSVLLLSISVFSASLLSGEPNLPPPDMKLKEPWTTIEKKGFNDWKIRQFVSWGGGADGGSIAFEFLTEEGIKFEVMVANPAYWTEADKEAKRQVIYLIESGRFYLLAPASKQEKHLLRILTDATDTQKGKGRVDPKYVRALTDKIKDRKPPEYYWPMTKQEVDEANKKADQDAAKRPANPFESKIEPR